MDRRRHHARRTETHHGAAEPGRPHSHRVAERPGAIAQSRRLSQKQHTRRGDRTREKGDSAVEGPGRKSRNSQTIAPAIRAQLFSARRRYNRTPGTNEETTMADAPSN